MRKAKISRAPAIRAALALATLTLALALAGCDGTGGPATGDGFARAEGLWNVATQEQVALTGSGTFVHQAFAHVNSNAAAGQEFVLAVGSAVSTGANAFTALTANNGATLRIIGINGRQEIRFTTGGDQTRLFMVGPTGSSPGSNPIRLILGNNITLVGRRQNQHGQTDHHNGALIQVRNGGMLEMEAGSIVRGHSSRQTLGSGGNGAAVMVDYHGVFTMRGGEITDNRAHHSNTPTAGGLFVRGASSTFHMTGGSIAGNYRMPGGAAPTPTPANVRLNGDAVRTGTGGTIGPNQ